MTRLLVALALLFAFVVPVAAEEGPSKHAQGLAAWERRDYEQAMQIFHELAEAGSAKAQYNVGILLLIRCLSDVDEGLQCDTAETEREAARWFRMAADQGDAKSQTMLSRAYTSWQGVAQDEAEAQLWLQRAAENGLAEAQFRIGKQHATGERVRKDYTEAAKWYRKAAEQGHAEAQYELGLLYRMGWGVAQHYGEGAAWTLKAAEQGDSVAQYAIGGMFEEGKGVPQDNVRAHMWYNIAAVTVEGGPAEAREALASKMTAADIAEAQDLARKWIETHPAKPTQLLQ